MEEHGGTYNSLLSSTVLKMVFCCRLIVEQVIIMTKTVTLHSWFTDIRQGSHSITQTHTKDWSHTGVLRLNSLKVLQETSPLMLVSACGCSKWQVANEVCKSVSTLRQHSDTSDARLNFVLVMKDATKSRLSKRQNSLFFSRHTNEILTRQTRDLKLYAISSLVYKWRWV